MINTATFFSIHTSFAKVKSPDAANCNSFSAAGSAVLPKQAIDVTPKERFDFPMPVSSSN
jgi:hypothetical protein